MQNHPRTAGALAYVQYRPTTSLIHVI